MQKKLYFTDKERKTAKNASQKKYSQTTKGRLTRKNRNETPEGRARINESNRKYMKVQREILGNRYIKQLLRAQTGTFRINMSPLVIEAKRTNLQLFRTMRSNN